MANARQGRESADYTDFIEHTQVEARHQLEQAREFLQTVQTLMEKIKNNDVVIEIDGPDGAV